MLLMPLQNYLRRLTAFVVVGVLSLSVVAQPAQFDHLSRLDKLKAAYLYSFTKFIDWPEFDRRASREFVVICLDKDDPVLSFLSEMVKDQHIGKQQWRVKVLPYEVSTRCDVAYFGQQAIPDPVSLQEIMVVSSDIRFHQNIATFSFYEEGKRLRFEVDMQQLQKLELEVSSELLKLARIKR